MESNNKSLATRYDVIAKEGGKIYGYASIHQINTKKAMNYLAFKIEKNISSERLGPGKYRSMTPKPIFAADPGTPRFQSGVDDKYLSRNHKPLLVKLNTPGTSRSIKKNGKQKITNNSFFQLQRAKNAKSKRITNYNKSKSKKLEKIVDKQRKSEIILNKHESINTKKTWTLLLLIVNAAFTLQSNYKAKSAFKKRVEKIYSFFYICSKFIGKIRISLKKIKKKKALRLIKICFLPVIKYRVREIKAKYRKVIIAVFEKISKLDSLLTLQNIWRSRIIRIQKAVRSFLACRYATYLSLIICWKRTVLSLLKQGEDCRKQPPFLTQFHYLHKYINKVAKNYIKTAYLSSHEYVFGLGIVSKKKKAAFTIFSRKQDFKEFALSVYSEKKIWEKINMKEYSHWKNFNAHPIEIYLNTTRFTAEHSKKRSIIKLLSQYTLKYGRICN